MIFLLTGQIRTGKTTRLARFVEACENIKIVGFLTPDRGGKRVFQNIGANSFAPFEVNSPEGAIQIGRFQFSKHAFVEGNAIISSFVTSRDENAILVIDEIGKLELNKQMGFWHGVCALSELQESQKVVVIVREELLEKATAVFASMNQRYQTLSADDLDVILQ